MCTWSNPQGVKPAAFALAKVLYITDSGSGEMYSFQVCAFLAVTLLRDTMRHLVGVTVSATNEAPLGCCTSSAAAGAADDASAGASAAILACLASRGSSATVSLEFDVRCIINVVLLMKACARESSVALQFACACCVVLK